MPIQLQTSFVPRKSSLMGPPEIGRHRSLSIFGLLAIGVFVLSAALAGAVFFYHGYLIREITTLDADLAKAKKSFEPEFVDVAERLNRRIESAKTLLSGHRTLSPLFDLLEKKTLENVRFQNFSFTAQGGSETTITMTGQAKSFNSVALQSDIFGEETYFKNPVFSNFNLNESGDVIFQFKTTVDPVLLRYSESLAVAGSDEAGTTTPSAGADE